MARQAVCLPSRLFKSKSEAIAYFKEMLGRYHDGEELNSNDDELLFELIQGHPEMEKKVGLGVKHFFCEKSPNHPTRCFHLERIDGTTTDFSYLSCISGNPPTLEQQFYDACRYSVSERLIQEKEALFKKAGGIMICQKTGDKITIQEAEYRHTMPRFRDIVKDFIAEFNITITYDQLSHGSDMQYVVKFADQNIENMFKKYHREKSSLSMFKKYER